MSEKHFNASMVRPLRERLGMTQRELAEAINAGPRTVARWESGKQSKMSMALRMNLIALSKKGGGSRG